MIKLRYFCCIFLLSFFCCKKPYNPRIIATSTNYLVVEGVINSGTDTTVIKLSRTVNVNSKTTTNPEYGAFVKIEDNQGNTWQLIEQSPGKYVSAGVLNLSSSQKYQINIATTDGEQYQSDFVVVKPTPSIDSVGYFIQNGGVQLYISTHDATNNTRYYRWEYDETWKFHTKYGAAYIVDTINKTINLRSIDQQISTCFGNDVSPNILLSSTSNLTSDIIGHYSLTNVALTSEKLEDKYSILVKQYALSQEAYQYYFFLKRNTEELGSLFDAQPSQLTGNIHCVTDASKIAIGYITATNVQAKRIFILNSQLPDTMTIYPYSCEIDTAFGDEAKTIFLIPPYNDVPIGLSPKGYLYSSVQCADCTIRGTTKTPSFWK